MEAIRQYLISVTAAAIICGCAVSILGKKGTVGGITKFLCGLFMTVTVISPLVDFRLPDMNVFWNTLQEKAQQSVAEGEIMAEEMKSVIITERVETYILDKADSMGLSITVDISLDDELLPDLVIIHGKAAPYAKTKLYHYITENLGIPEEKLSWT